MSDLKAVTKQALEENNNNDLDKYISAITLNGVVWLITQTNNTFCLEAKDCFVEGMTDQTKIIGGLTIATARRAELHSLFDKWLDKIIQTKLYEKTT